MNVYVKMYPAKNGDCFLISFGKTEEEKKHFLIDCGYVDTFQKYLKNDLIKIGKSGDDDLFRNFLWATYPHIKNIKNHPNGRINFLTIDEQARLQANMKKWMSEI